MLSLHFLINTTRSHIFCNINPHPLPLEALLQILIHLSLTRVHCIRTAMIFPRNLHLYCSFLWYTKMTPKKNSTILLHTDLARSPRQNTLANSLKQAIMRLRHSHLLMQLWLNQQSSLHTGNTSIAERNTHTVQINYQRHISLRNTCPTERICNNICLARMILDSQIIILNQLKPPPLSQV